MYLTLENDLMPLAKEIKCITGVCCGAWSENIACLWQRSALKTASAWSVWNPCLTVSITKTLMFLFLLEKDFIYFEINPRLPKCTVCFQAQHMRAAHQGHIAEGSGEHSFFGSWATLAKESAWNQPHGSRGLQGFGMWGHLGCTAVLQCRAMAPPQPRGTRDSAQVVLCCTGGLQGYGRMRSQCDWVKPKRPLFPMGLIWFACSRQDIRTCVMHEGRVMFVWCPLAFRSVTQC